MATERAYTIEANPSREAWLKARRQGIGGSDAAAVIGLDPWKSPTSLYADKLELAEADQAETEAMEWGLRLERVMRDAYAEKTGRVVIAPAAWEIRRSREHPFMVYSPDGHAIDDKMPGIGVLQLKAVNAFKSEEWDDEPPPHYLVQLQHEMTVEGAAWGSLAVLIGGQRFRWFDVDRHGRFIEALVEREAEFWQRLLKQDPPPVDGSDASREMLRRLYPKHQEGLVVNLPGEATEWDRERLEALEEIKRSEAKKQAAENAIKAAIGGAEVGMLPGLVSYSWKASERKGYTVEPSIIRTLRRREAK